MLNFRKAKKLSPGCTADRGHRWEWNPRSLAPNRVYLLNHHRSQASLFRFPDCLIWFFSTPQIIEYSQDLNLHLSDPIAVSKFIFIWENPSTLAWGAFLHFHFHWHVLNTQDAPGFGLYVGSTKMAGAGGPSGGYVMVNVIDDEAQTSAVGRRDS